LSDTEAVERFQREVDLVRRLEHPNTVRIFDRGETSDGLQFYVMELVKGRTLSDVARDDGPLPPARVKRIAEQVLKSLGEAHELGIVHRDLKPGNIILTNVFAEADFVKVLDFGIGKLVAGLDKGDTITTGGPIGTPLYMSPEQATESKDLDGRSDLYALGLIMHELWTGQRAVDAPSPLEVVLEHVRPEPVRIDRRVAETPLGRVIWRATLKDRTARFGDAMEMLKALQAIAPDDEGSFDQTSEVWSTGPDSIAMAATLPETPAAKAARLATPTPPERHRRSLGKLGGVTIALAVVCAIVIAWSVLSGPTDTPDVAGDNTQPAMTPAEPAPSEWAQNAARQFDTGIVQSCWRDNSVPGVTSAHLEVTLTFQVPGSTIASIRIEGVDDAQLRRCIVMRGQSFRFEGAPDVNELVVRSELAREGGAQ